MSDETAIAAPPPQPPSLMRRIIFFPLTLMLLAILVFAAGSIIANRLLRLLPHANSPWLLANAAIVILSLGAVFWLFFRYVDRDGAELFARRGWAKELLGGLAAGAL